MVILLNYIDFRYLKTFEVYKMIINYLYFKWFYYMVCYLFNYIVMLRIFYRVKEIYNIFDEEDDDGIF